MSGTCDCYECREEYERLENDNSYLTSRARELEQRVQALYDANKLLIADNERLGGKFPYPYTPTKGELDRYGQLAFAATDQRCRELTAANKRLVSANENMGRAHVTLKEELRGLLGVLDEAVGAPIISWNQYWRDEATRLARVHGAVKRHVAAMLEGLEDD